jgi:hypothetical protein
MEKEFVEYAEALELNKLGFDEPCFSWWGSDGVFKQDYDLNNAINAPLFQQAFRWFREKYGYWSYIKEATKGTSRFYIEKFDEKFFNSDIIDTYEEAELACLKKLISIVKEKQL